MNRLILLVESRIRGDVYVRFGGEHSETDHSNMIRRWVLSLLNEVKKVYEQGKEYYDKLKAVNNLVKDARKVQQTVLLVGDVSEMYVQNFGKMMNDPNFSAQELTAISNGYSALLNESTELLKELKQIVSSTSLSLNDKERMDIIDRVYKEVKEYHSLVRYYTNKNISVSLLRAKNRTIPKECLTSTELLTKNIGSYGI